MNRTHLLLCVIIGLLIAVCVLLGRVDDRAVVEIRCTEANNCTITEGGGR